MQKILLASGSFLRKFIMDTSRLPYESIASDLDESIFDHLPAGERVVALAEAKGKLVAEKYPDAIIIAADTVTADTDGNVFTKKTHAEDPIDTAMGLSGKTIVVFSGCYFYSPRHTASSLSESRVTYQHFSRENLLRLTEGDNHAIRSGALGVFHDAPGFTLVERWEGSYTGTMGLPMEFVYAQLEEAGYFSVR
jgi:septum formation protein